MTVRAATTSELAWIVERTSCALTPGARGLAAVDAQGRIVGMVVFDGWTESAAVMHVAFDKPIACRSLLFASFDYLFNQCGRELALGILPSHNEKALAFDKKVGFREAYRVRDGWAAGDDLVLIELRKNDCRWLRRGER